MNNLNFIFPEIFISLSIMFLLVFGVFKKNSSDIIYNLSILFLIIIMLIIFNNSFGNNITLFIMRQSMLTNARLFQQSYQHPQSITAAISQAKLVCERNNVRLTLAREEILKIVWLSHQPLGAYQIQDELSKLLSKKIAPPTVYRALAFLIDNGLVHKLTSLNAYVGCPFPNSEHSNIFLICKGCRKVAEVVHLPTNETIQDVCSKTKFGFDAQHIEVFGTCSNCSSHRA